MLAREFILFYNITKIYSIIFNIFLYVEYDWIALQLINVEILVLKIKRCSGH